MFKTKLHKSIELMMDMDIDINFGKVALTNLAHVCITRNVLEKKYQVCSDDARFLFSGMYSNKNTAIDKFISILTHIKSKEQ